MEQRLEPEAAAPADRRPRRRIGSRRSVTPELLAQDPDNRLLARGPRFRVEAEIVRDIALAASGLLNPKVGGPSVYPPAPAFLFLPPASYGPKIWNEATGPDRYRRALYTFRFRSVPYPVLQTFDAPNGDFACVRRARSNTPLQALTTLNEPLFLECARAPWHATTLDEGGATDAERLDVRLPPLRWRGRRPSREAASCLSLLRASSSDASPTAGQPLGTGRRRPRAARRSCPTGITPAQLAAWTVVARVLLNLDETITKE